MRPCVLALIFFLTPAAALAQQYVAVKTPNFTIVTDAGETKGRDIAEHFEQVRAAFGSFFIKESMSVPLPLTIIAFQASREFQQYIPKTVDKLKASWPSTVQHGEDQDLIAFDTSPIPGGRR